MYICLHNIYIYISLIYVEKLTTAEQAEFVDLILGEMLTMTVEATAEAQHHNIFIEWPLCTSS